MLTRLLLLCICIGSYLSGIAQPANNPCSGAIPITSLDGSCTMAQDITGATEDVAPGGCTVGANENVWYSFVADGVSAEIVVSNAIGTPEITIVQFPGAPCDAGSSVEVACSTGSPLVVDNLLVDGATYYVMVAFSNNPDGAFDICIDNPNPAPYDACINAQALANLEGACATYNNNFPSTDVLVPNCFTGSTYNVWFSFVAVGVSLDASIAAGGPGVAQLAVVDFTGAVCNNTGAQVLGCATGTNHIILDNDLVIGETYYVVVGFQNTDFNGNGVGNFQLCVDNPVPAVNDDCMDAIAIPTNILNDDENCHTIISGNALNNDWPSTDVGLFECWNAGDSYNIWYSFVAQGNDVSIEVDPEFPESAQIALVEFTGAPCDIAGAIQLECAYGTILDFNDNLVIGNTYYIAVGFDNNAVGDFCMNVFNPVPPPNDHPCDAIPLPTNGNCMDGTTIYANPDGYTLPPDCQTAYSNTVWYTVSLEDPNNVGFEIDLELDEVTPGTTVSVVMYALTDCNSLINPKFFYCGDPPTEPIEFAPVDETATYLIMVGTSEPNETDFEICVDEIPPCFTNDLCTQATVIDNVQSDMAFVCVEGCNLYADPETINNDCQIGVFGTVWFQVMTDGNAALMNIQVTSQEFSAPTITLFHAVPDCNNLQMIGQTNSGLPCIVGSGGEAESFGSEVGANAIYYIAVSALNSSGGEFEICVNTISEASVCVLDREIEITGRSSGGPLTGPFFPGETVSICMNVNAYTASNNGCQWFQGMIPVFGNGWDPTSFDADGQPLNATVNGQPMGIPNNGIYGTSTWNWFTDVDYHYNHPFYQLGDFDDNGSIDMCNVLYDPDCPNTGGLTGGCCNPCWGAPLGTILPGGWFAYGIDGSCPGLGPPVRVDWGDGNSCGGPMGPWQFCFDLNVRPYPDCLEDPSTMNLSLGFFTTADGETGAWTGNASVCALDQPAKLTLPMCCNELDTDEEVLDPICSDNIIVYVIDKPGVEYWQWQVSPGGVTGATGGEGGPGSVIINTLVNAGSDVETVEYTFLGFAGGACPVFEHTMLVDVYPKIQVTLDPLVACATPTEPYTITPNVIGGSGNYEYLWSPGGSQGSSIMVANPVNGTQYVVTVNDDIGCFGTASMVINVYSTFPVDINAPVVEQCLVDGPLTIEAEASNGIAPYNFVWLLPDMTNINGESVTSDLSGQFLVEVTDDEGCIGKDSISLTLHESPEVTIEAVDGALAICEGESTTLSGQATGGESPYIYFWDTPDGPDDGKTIEAVTPGIFIVTVEDNNGCTSIAEIEIEPQPQPMPDLGDDILQCEDFSDPVELCVSEEFDDYQWSVGAGGDGDQCIEVYNAGTYTVTVTNEAGCTGVTDVAINLYPNPVFAMPDQFEICPGGSITLDADDFGGPWDIVQWSECGSCFNMITINTPSLHEVTVYDDQGCTAVQTFEVVESAMLSPNLQADNVICTGETITITAAPGFANYQWSANVTPSGNTATVTSPGTFSITVQDASGCSGSEEIEITSGDITVDISGTTSICANVQTTLDAGPGYAMYQWDFGPGTQTVTVEEGTYVVTVTSSDGCTATDNITVVETPFVPSITGDPMICQTSETSVLDAGGPYASYAWSPNANGATTQTISVTTPGTYSVTITDLVGCVGTASFDVDNHPVPFVAITGSPDFCVGGSTQLSATAGYPTYVWSPSGNAELITVNTAGNYIVTVTDVNGCTNTASAVVNPPYQETVDIIGTVTFCPGDQATLAVPTGYATVTWSTGESTDTIYVTNPGPVSVTVVDTDGCIASDAVTTVASAVLVPTITGDNAICDAGTAILNAGPGYDTYTWSSGLGTNSTATVNAAGTYTVTVTDGSCMGTDDFVVTGSSSPFATITSSATACNIQEPGGPTTTVNFNSLVTGGDTGGSWLQASGPSSVNLGNLNSVNFNGLAAGTYTFTYTTNSAIAPCTEATYNLSISVTDCACPNVELGLAPDLCNDLGSIDLSTIIVGEPGGQWAIESAPSGSNPAIITGSIFDASTADPGTYTISYTVAGLPSYCNNVVTTTIEVLKTPSAGNAATPLQFCSGETQNVNLATLLVGADAGGFWLESSSNPSTGGAFDPATGRFNITSQQPGTYTFDYVIPGSGPCPDDMVTVEVVIENNPVADAGATATLSCNQSSAVLGGSLSSVGPEFSYSWTTVDGVISNPNVLNAVATSQGTYILTVLNINTGCSATDEVIIDQIGDFPTEMELFVQSPDCEGDPPGNAQVSFVVGGTEPFMYSLNGAPPVVSPVFHNLAAGDYTIEVTDAVGCKLLDSFTIQDLVVVDLDIVNYVNDTLIFALGDTIELSFLFSGTSDTPDSVVWKLNDSVICINCPLLELEAKLAGKITLEAYDVRGCSISQSITFLVVRDRDIYIPNVFSPNDDGINDFFSVYTKADDVEVAFMEVYTRWGDLMYREENLTPNSQNQGWDGRFRGETLNPGVYVYRIKLIHGDGLEENLSGDITIIR